MIVTEKKTALAEKVESAMAYCDPESFAVVYWMMNVHYLNVAALELFFDPKKFG